MVFDWVMNRGWRCFEALNQKSLAYIEGTLGRNVNVKITFDEASDGTE